MLDPDLESMNPDPKHCFSLLLHHTYPYWYLQPFYYVFTLFDSIYPVEECTDELLPKLFHVFTGNMPPLQVIFFVLRTPRKQVQDEIWRNNIYAPCIISWQPVRTQNFFGSVERLYLFVRKCLSPFFLKHPHKKNCSVRTCIRFSRLQFSGFCNCRKRGLLEYR